MIYILSGISGSGKSTLVENILKTYGHDVVSADHFFMKNGVYTFDPSRLSEAHADCFHRYLYSVRQGRPTIVDNTNIQTWELSPYVLAAQAYNLSYRIIELDVLEEHVQKCADRNKHGVPVGAIWNQWHGLKRRSLPPWWNHSVIPAIVY